jgi:hypothetical protein
MESEFYEDQIKIHRNYEFRLYPNDNHTTNADCNASLNILDYDKWAAAQQALIARWSTSGKSKSIIKLGLW